MPEQRQITDHFKSYLALNRVYKGGKPIKSKDGEKVYKLSSNEHPIGASPKAVEALQQHIEDLHIYPDVTDARLREALSEHFDGAIGPDQFITANSGSGIIDLAVRAFLREGDEILISSPSFFPYEMFSRWAGAKIVDVPLKGDDYQLDVDGLLGAITDRTRILFLTSPNNPTGTYIPKEQMDSLVEQLPKDILIVFDEVYRHFADAPDYTTALPFIQAGYPMLGLNSFSKTYGLASLRIGYGYSTPELANYIRQICRPFFIPKLSMEAAIAALSDVEFVEESAALVKAEKQYLYKEYEAMGISYVPTQANFILINPPGNADAFVQHLQEHGITVRPAKNFGAKEMVRISIGTHEANMALVKAIQKFVVVTN